MAIDLKSIREEAGVTQKDVAAALGMSARSGRVSVAQIEARTDWLLSSLAAYLRAVNASGELVVSVPRPDGETTEIRFEL